MLKVGICGLGTVGGGTLQLLQQNKSLMERRLSGSVEVTEVAMRSNKLGVDLDGIRVAESPLELAKSGGVDVVVETIGGYTVAKDVIKAALSSGKHVVTANKALIAEHGNELSSLAQENGVTLAYEAAVAGAIPIIKVVRESLAGNDISQVAGIINGTGNFILTKMRDEGQDFDLVLKEAQDLGYAEADPTFDVEGIDAAHKLTILASVAFGMPLSFDQVHCEGISKVTTDDLYFAGKLGYEIKHLGVARKTEKGVELRVQPTLVPNSCLLAHVDGVMNAVMTTSDAAGTGMHYGPGAGAHATGSSIISDLVDIARSGEKYQVPVLGFNETRAEGLAPLPFDQSVMGHYLRLSLHDRPGVVAEVASALSQHGISIDAMRQEEGRLKQGITTLVILCHEIEESTMQAAVASLQSLDSVSEAIAHIRVEHFE